MSEQTKQNVCPTRVVKAICISDKRGIEKRAIEEGYFLVDFGIGGDARTGHWHRQVSLLSYDRVRMSNERGVNVIDGVLGENLVVEGTDLRSLPVGTRLYAGTVLLEMTQIGKECRSHCAIYRRMGECAMPKEGVFARVIREGIIRPGDVMRVRSPVEEHPFMAAVITLSDRGARGERKDESGPTAKELLEAVGYEMVELLLLPDESVQLKTQLIHLADSCQVDLVLTSGGTGLSLRDQTPEATTVVAGCGAPGIAEFIRMKSMEVTDRAMFGRGVPVIRGKTSIANLPGSPRAVKESLDFIMGSLDHGLKTLRGSVSECARSQRGFERKSRHTPEIQVTVIQEYRHLPGMNAYPLQMGIYVGDDMVV